MKKLILITLVLIGTLTLSGCGEKDVITVLPDLSGKTVSEIENVFKDTDVVLSFHESGTASIVSNGVFIEYTNGQSIGDDITDVYIIYVLVYPEYHDISDIYFVPLVMEYDGPILDLELLNMEAIELHIDNPSTSSDNDIVHDATGGAFEVTLRTCADGDTAIFNYPTNIYDAIVDTSKRARFLNMDTEETYSGSEEEWGKLGSVYTCLLLTSAKSIVIQTDPGDNLLGNYDRLLSWIWVKLPGETDYHLLNYMVVKQGLAQVKFEYGAGTTISYGDYTYNEWMHLAEDYAIVNNMGQWGDLLDYYWDYENDDPDWDRWYE